MGKIAKKSKVTGRTPASAIREEALEYAFQYKKSASTFHFKNLIIKNFRCLENISIDSLERVNLITGINNAGKTTLLEAIFLLVGLNNADLASRIERWRGLPIPTELSKNAWASLFTKFEDSATISISGKNLKGSARTLAISVTTLPSSIVEEKSIRQGTESIGISGQGIAFEYSDEKSTKHKVVGIPLLMRRGDIISFSLQLEPRPLPSPMPGVFITAQHKGFIEEDLTRFSNLRIRQKDQYLIEALKTLEPRLEKLEILAWQGTNMIHGHMRGYVRPVPYPLLGDGVRRVLSILLAIGMAQENGNMVLVDEIENGIHHSTMKSIWKAIAEAAELFSTQVYTTTHSHECIVAAHEVFKQRKHYDFRLHRLDRINGKIKAITYDESSLEGALSIPLEVRGWPIE